MAERSRSFMAELCARRTPITVVFLITTVFLLVQIPILVVAEPGSVQFTISVMNMVGLVLFTGGFGWVLWRCRQRDLEE